MTLYFPHIVYDYVNEIAWDRNRAIHRWLTMCYYEPIRSREESDEPMPRKVYSAEQKGNALRLCDEIGVKRASEETGILKVTLYKWRRISGVKPAITSRAKNQPVTPTEG